MKKADAIAIKKLTSSMPPEIEFKPAKHVFTGEELMLGGYKNLDKNGVYTIDPIDGYEQHTVSHEARIKDAFKHQGIPGVRAYVDKVKTKYFGQ